jgi:transposase
MSYPQDCPTELKHLGEDISEILEYVPASLKIIQYVRPKLVNYARSLFPIVLRN